MKPYVTSYANSISTKYGGSIDCILKYYVPMDHILEELQRWQAFSKEAFNELKFSTKDEGLLRF